MTAPQAPRPSRSPDKVRHLNAHDLGIESPVEEPGEVVVEPTEVEPRPVLDESDPVLAQVVQLIEDGHGGVVFRGPPGTSKSWYAQAIGERLAAFDPGRVRYLQFHSSYQYEDFVEGFVPDEFGAFVMSPKHLVTFCDQARDHADKTFVLVIDEISRVDPSRVFGEALTYIEGSRRGMEFFLASGRRFSIPRNVVILATMNEFDRGVVQVDEALERRLAFVEMNPDPALLRGILRERGFAQPSIDLIGRFFEQTLLRHPNKYCRVGHAYFRSVRDAASLRRLWQHQLKFVLERAFPLGEEQGFDDLDRRWKRLVAELEEIETGQVTAVAASDGSSTPGVAPPSQA